MKPIQHNPRRTRTGFTLIEILVVLSIAALVTAITIGSYGAMRDSNARTACQANMAQIYHAIRLYAADYNGEVPFYDPDNTLGLGTGIGLWALYTFPGSSSTLAPAGLKPEGRYIKDPDLFHCPADLNDEFLYLDEDKDEYNPAYLSYQPVQSDFTPIGDPQSGGQFSYDPIRTDDITETGPGGNLIWQRQLLHFDGSTFVSRPPTNDTVILWCGYHRNGDGTGDDNVLFWDGTIQSIPVEQEINGDTYIGWQRLPEVP